MRKPEAGILVGMVVVLFIAGFSNALVVKPSWIEYNGNVGEWVMKNITVVNNENKTVNVTIQPSSTLTGAYISNPVLTLAPHQQQNITIGVQLVKSGYGFIFYSYDGQQINQFILLTPESKNVSVDMLPASPPPGGSIVFLLNPYNVRGAGFVYVVQTGHIYNFTIVNGMAFVTLSKDDYGDAVAVFQGENFQTRVVFTIKGLPGNLELQVPKTATTGSNVTILLKYNGEPVSNATITITSPSGVKFTKSTDVSGKAYFTAFENGKWGIEASYKEAKAEAFVNVSGTATTNLQFYMPSNPKVGDEKYITLMMGANPVKNNNVMVQYPDGTMQAFITDSNGQFKIKFSQAGTYHFVTSYSGITKSADLTVSKAPMNVSYLPKYPIVGNDVTFSLAKGSHVVITGGSTTIDDYANNGVFNFIPDRPGQYTLKAETNDKIANIKFTVYQQPDIVVMDKYSNPVEKAVKGETYTISVSANGLTNVNVIDPQGQKITLTLLNGEAKWKPDKVGIYTLSTPQVGFYYKAIKTITVTQPQTGGGLLEYFTIIIILIGIAAIVKYRERIKGYFHKEEEQKEERKEVE